MNAKELRKIFLDGSGPIIEHILATASGEDGPLKNAYGRVAEEKMEKVWDALVPIIQTAEDAVQVSGLSDGPIATRVDNVLTAVASGQLTIQQGKRLIEMLQAGFEITELTDLISKLEAAGIEL